MHKVSVIIPALNEEKNIVRCIKSAKKLNPLEIIVVDGGSIDRTKELAKKEGALVLESSKGRGIQLNRGASSANGEILLFLHADSFFLDIDYRRFSELIKRYPNGFFRLRFDKDTPSIRIVEFFANLRSRIFRLPYGDQAIFLKKELFIKLGGFKNYPFLEDLELVRRIRKFEKIKPLPFYVIASSRRIIKNYPLSPIFVSLRNVLIVILYLLGIDPEKLLRFYK